MNENVGIDPVVDDLQIEAMAIGDRLPVREARATQRIDAQPDPRAGDLVEVDDRRQLPDIGGAVVVPVSPVDRVVERQALDSLHAGAQQLVRRVLDLARDVGVGRAAVGRVVLEPAVLGRVVRRRDYDAVGARATAGVVGHVVGQDRVRDRRRRREPALGVDLDVHAAGHEHLHRGPERRLGQRVRVAPEEQGPVDPLGGAVPDDRLADREDVILGERPVERRPSVS